MKNGKDTNIIHLQHHKNRTKTGDNSGTGSTPHIPFFNLGKLPVFTRSMALCFLTVQLMIGVFLSPDIQVQILSIGGLIPVQILQNFQPITLIGFLGFSFLHGGWYHAGFNTIMMLALGKFFEDMHGWQRSAVLFTCSALTGAVLYIALNPTSSIPMVGASAGISGFFGAMLLIFYRRGLIPALSPGLRKWGLWPMILIWSVLLMLMGWMSGPSTAWEAHLGGFFAGLAYVHWIERRNFIFWK